MNTVLDGYTPSYSYYQLKVLPFLFVLKYHHKHFTASQKLRSLRVQCRVPQVYTVSLFCYAVCLVTSFTQVVPKFIRRVKHTWLFSFTFRKTCLWQVWGKFLLFCLPRKVLQGYSRAKSVRNGFFPCYFGRQTLLDEALFSGSPRKYILKWEIEMFWFFGLRRGFGSECRNLVRALNCPIVK